MGKVPSPPSPFYVTFFHKIKMPSDLQVGSLPARLWAKNY